GRNFGEQFGSEWACGELGAAPLLADLVDDLLADLVPQPGCPGRSERLDLEGRAGVVETGGNNPCAARLHLASELEAFAGNYLDAAEVDIGSYGVGFALVEGPGLTSIRRC